MPLVTPGQCRQLLRFFGLRVRHSISASISQGLRPCMSVSRFPPLTRVPGTDLEPTLIQADLILTHDTCNYTSVLTRSHAQVPFQVGVNWEGTLLSPAHLGLEPGLCGSCIPALPSLTRPGPAFVAAPSG